MWSYGSWIYDYLCNQCLTLWVRIPQGVIDTKLCDKVCQWRALTQWFSLGTPVSSTNKTDCHDITEIFLKVALNTIRQISERSYLFTSFRDHDMPDEAEFQPGDQEEKIYDDLCSIKYSSDSQVSIGHVTGYWCCLSMDVQ